MSIRHPAEEHRGGHPNSLQRADRQPSGRGGSESQSLRVMFLQRDACASADLGPGHDGDDDHLQAGSETHSILPASAADATLVSDRGGSSRGPVPGFGATSATAPHFLQLSLW